MQAVFVVLVIVAFAAAIKVQPQPIAPLTYTLSSTTDGSAYHLDLDNEQTNGAHMHNSLSLSEMKGSIDRDPSTVHTWADIRAADFNNRISCSFSGNGNMEPIPVDVQHVFISYSVEDRTCTIRKLDRHEPQESNSDSEGSEVESWLLDLPEEERHERPERPERPRHGHGHHFGSNEEEQEAPRHGSHGKHGRPQRPDHSNEQEQEQAPRRGGMHSRPQRPVRPDARASLVEQFGEVTQAISRAFSGEHVNGDGELDEQDDESSRDEREQHSRKEWRGKQGKWDGKKDKKHGGKHGHHDDMHHSKLIVVLIVAAIVVPWALLTILVVGCGCVGYRLLRKYKKAVRAVQSPSSGSNVVKQPDTVFLVPKTEPFELNEAV